jgi:hypothetical protein
MSRVTIEHNGPVIPKNKCVKKKKSNIVFVAVNLAYSPSLLLSLKPAATPLIPALCGVVLTCSL